MGKIKITINLIQRQNLNLWLCFTLYQWKFRFLLKQWKNSCLCTSAKNESVEHYVSVWVWMKLEVSGVWILNEMMSVWGHKLKDVRWFINTAVKWVWSVKSSWKWWKCWKCNWQCNKNDPLKRQIVGQWCK